MTSLSQYRVVDTQGLKALAFTSKNFNRSFDVPENIDPNGLHLLDIVIWGHNDDHAEVAHHRVRAMLKLSRLSEPMDVIFDMEASTWQLLRKVTPDMLSA